MNKNPKATFAIGGHADSTGSEAINFKISDKRAAAVRDYLVKKGSRCFKVISERIRRSFSN